MIVININRNAHIIFDDNGNVVKKETLVSDVVTSWILHAYINKGISFTNCQLLNDEAKESMRNAGLWSNGEVCFVERKRLGIEG